MSGSIYFDYPQGWYLGLPAALVVGFAAWRQLKRGLPRSRVIRLAALRTVALVALLILAARPIWVAKEPPAAATRSVVLLMDRSESMSLEDNGASRYQQAV